MAIRKYRRRVYRRRRPMFRRVLKRRPTFRRFAKRKVAYRRRYRARRGYSKRVRYNKVVRGVLRFTTQSNLGENVVHTESLDYEDVKTQVYNYLQNGYSSIFSFFKVTGITKRSTLNVPSAWNTSNASIPLIAQCYDGEAHGRKLKVETTQMATLDNIMRNPSAKRTQWYPGKVRYQHLKPYWPSLYNTPDVDGVYSTDQAGFGKRQPWWAIEYAGSVPNCSNAIQFVVETGTSISQTHFWTVHILLKGRENDMEYTVTA